MNSCGAHHFLEPLGKLPRLLPGYERVGRSMNDQDGRTRRTGIDARRGEPIKLRVLRRCSATSPPSPGGPGERSSDRPAHRGPRPPGPGTRTRRRVREDRGPPWHRSRRAWPPNGRPPSRRYADVPRINMETVGVLAQPADGRFAVVEVPRPNRPVLGGQHIIDAKAHVAVAGQRGADVDFAGGPLIAVGPAAAVNNHHGRKALPVGRGGGEVKVALLVAIRVPDRRRPFLCGSFRPPSRSATASAGREAAKGGGEKIAAISSLHCGWRRREVS